MWQLLVDWGPWVAGLGAGLGILGALLGLKSVLGILEKVVDILSPILKLVSVALAGLLGWIWRNLVWPEDPKRPSLRRGIKDIGDDWVTICTVALAFFALWAVMDLRHNMTVDQLASCQTDKVKLEKLIKAPKKQDDWFFRLW